MSYPVKTGGLAHVPAARGGLVDGRSTGATAPATPRRPILNDRRSTR